MIFKIGRRVGFDELAPLPYFERPEPKVQRKKTFKSFWMTTDASYDTVKRVETETAKKKADKEEDQKIAKEAIAKNKKMKRKALKKPPVIRKIKSNPKL